MGFYAKLKGANLKISHRFRSQFIREKQGGLFSTTHQSYIACRNSKSAMPWVNHQHSDRWPTRRQLDLIISQLSC